MILPALTPEDVDLDAILQTVVVGITGLDGSMVRPRWQATVPKQPEPTANWCAIGVASITPNDGPSIIHDPAFNNGAGGDFYTRHEAIEVISTFYGPKSQMYAALLRDGIAIPQNTEPLQPFDMVWVSCGPMRTFPELVNQQWIRRQDMNLSFRRKVTRVYPVLTIAIADVHLFDDTNVDATILVPSGSKLLP